MTNLLDPTLRQVVATNEIKFLPYDRYGKARPNFSWQPLSQDKEKTYELFLLRIDAGGASQPHEHMGFEEFLMLEGELEDCDGTVYRPGDFVSFSPGSRHSSTSHQGCLLLVFLRGRNRAIEVD
jgi:anti-sigma factor ChrR (cupin superfamily)